MHTREQHLGRLERDVSRYRNLSLMLALWVMVVANGCGLFESEQPKPEELINASKNGDLEEVRRLLDSGADAKAKDDLGRTAVMFAAGSGHVEVVGLLLDRGAAVNAQDKEGKTALMWAVMGVTSRQPGFY